MLDDIINKIHCSDCIEFMKSMPENSVDAIVTDPPYGLEFMGKEWDKLGAKTGSVTERWVGNDGKSIPSNRVCYGKNVKSMQKWHQQWASLVLKVLKPGGFLLAFGGTRTYHRLACAIEDAGFEIRDCIMYLYGSGFPKSLDISKAIDKMGAKDTSWFIEYALKVCKERGIPKSELSRLFLSKNSKPTGWIYNKVHTQPLTIEQFNKIKDFLDLPFKDIQEAEREIIGKGKAGLTKGNICKFSGETEFDITSPSTPEAQQWNGWGTALKPACEPIVVARKPLSEKSVALNVLKWGTGGINIDGGRIGNSDGHGGGIKRSQKEGSICYGKYGNYKYGDGFSVSQKGRFPANIILDEESAKALDQQSGKVGGGHWPDSKTTGFGEFGGGKSEYFGPGRHDGHFGASRFFYVAKASRAERNMGLKGFEERDAFNLGHKDNPGRKAPKKSLPRANFHPTVKPVALMRYLVRLVTPKNGIVLDPFIGSGTTGIACLKEGFKFIGIEKEPDYVKIARARINHVPKRLDKFVKV